VDDINASAKSMTTATTTDSGSTQKAQLLHDKLGQMQTTGPLSPRPQLAKPTVSTGVNETSKLLSDIKDIKDLNELDYDLFQNTLQEILLEYLKPRGIKEVGRGVEASQKFSDYLDGIEKSNSADYPRLQKLGGTVKAFKNEPSETNYAALLAAVIVEMVKMKVMTQQSQTEVIGLYIGLAFSNTEFQAEQIIDQGFMAMVGAAVQAAATVAMIGAGYLTQKQGFDTRHQAHVEKERITDFDNKLKQWQKEKFQVENKQTNVNNRLQQYETRINSPIDYKEDLNGPPLPPHIVEEQHNEFTNDLAQASKARKEQKDLALQAKNLNSKYQSELEGIMASPDSLDLTTYAPNILKQDVADQYITKLREKIYDFDQIAQGLEARGFAMVQATGIAQLGSAAMSSVTKAAESDATIDATNASNYEKIVQMALQYLQSMLSALDGLISLLTEILRSKNEAMSVMAGNTKMGG